MTFSYCLNLAVPLDLGMISNAIRTSLGLGRDVQKDKSAAAAVKLRNRLTVDRKKDTLVLAVSMSSEDPQRAQTLTSSLLKYYLEDRVNESQIATSKVLDALQAQLSDQVKRLSRAESEVERYKISNKINSTDGQLSDERQISKVTDQLNAERLDLVKLQIEIQPSKTNITIFYHRAGYR